MRGAHIVATCWFTVNFYTASTETVPENHEQGTISSETEENRDAADHYTFVALIDIVFADSSKRTCTGTIIHDYVVITAGHCFIKESSSPELTLSFIVIGSKKMFDSGYEQYLPIERYKIHPRFKGWTADLALVYTFAAMTSDKSGKVLHLAPDKMKHPMDTTVTVLSWGRNSDKFKHGPMKIYSKNVPETTGVQPDETEEEVGAEYNRKVPEPHGEDGIHATQMRGAVTASDNRPENSRYLTEKQFRVGTQSRKDKDKGRRFQDMSKRRLPDPIKAHYSNWTRRMGPQQNNLTVETFSFSNLQSCKRLVELVMPPVYEFKDMSDVVCYSSEDYVVTSDDAGAPAVRNGRLYAVTVGGVDTDGEQVAIGMRIACFCYWIASNLPSGGVSMRCCENCCSYNRTQSSRGRTSTPIRSKTILYM